METMKLWPSLETATIVKKKIITVLHQIFHMHSRCWVIFIFLVSPIPDSLHIYMYKHQKRYHSSELTTCHKFCKLQELSGSIAVFLSFINTITLFSFCLLFNYKIYTIYTFRKDSLCYVH